MEEKRMEVINREEMFVRTSIVEVSSDMMKTLRDGDPRSRREAKVEVERLFDEQDALDEEVKKISKKTLEDLVVRIKEDIKEGMAVNDVLFALVTLINEQYVSDHAEWITTTYSDDDGEGLWKYD